MDTHQTSPASHRGVSLEAVFVGVPRIDPGEDVLKHDREENMYIYIRTSPNVLGMLVVFLSSEFPASASHMVMRSGFGEDLGVGRGR